MRSLFVRLVVTLGLAWACTPGWSLQVQDISPEGEVGPVRQWRVRFDGVATVLGDPQASAPATLQCSPAAPAGQGRWIDAQQWTYTFNQDLPPGTRCQVRWAADLRSPQGQPLQAPPQSRFQVFPARVTDSWPSAGSAIEEDQHFVLLFNGDIDAQAVLSQSACTAQGVGERIALHALTVPERVALIKAKGLGRIARQTPQRLLAVACQRRFNANERVQLHLALPGTNVQRLDFRVREPFLASLRCERENAQAGCMPLRPIELGFNAAVPQKLLQGIVLQAGDQRLSPQIERGDASADPDHVRYSVRFAAPLAAATAFSLVLPAGFQDAAGRPLHNAERFPMPVQTAELPPLSKFADAPFGLVERLAEPDGAALLPVTVRGIESARIDTLQLKEDADIITWYRRVKRYHDYSVPRKLAMRQSPKKLVDPLNDEERLRVPTRTVSLLDGLAQRKTLTLPTPPGATPNGLRPFEVVGIPLPAGFHVLELHSARLGQVLLDARYGAQRDMVVRTSALVTNLAVHFKRGREDALVWVTTLDRGQPVAGARVNVSACDGRVLARGQTDAQGLLRLNGLSPQAPRCNPDADDPDGEPVQAYFVSARAIDARSGVEDLGFVWSDWTRGIEAWRFDLPTSEQPEPDAVAHTVFDRTLVRVGDTVGMKHLLRTQTRSGLALPERTPQRLRIVHEGSGQEFTQALDWQRSRTGGLSAVSTFSVPQGARAGWYQVLLGQDDVPGVPVLASGRFRVEAFRLPVLQGRIAPAQTGALVGTTALPVQVQLDYTAGGPAAGLPVQVSALLRPKRVAFDDDYPAFVFTPPPQGLPSAANDDSTEDSAADDARVVAHRQDLVLDAQGAGQVRIAGLPLASQPQELVLQASYPDPNGAIQSLRSSHTLWPAAVIAGLRVDGWLKAGQRVPLQALALGLDGSPRAGVALRVTARARTILSTRKRMVGGFYAYDNQTQERDLGTVCSGRSDTQGLLQCEAELAHSGEVLLQVQATDADGRQASAARAVYVTGRGELWFGGDNHDRIDLLPERKTYQPGETARLQVRMPFREATALLSVEREGVLHTEVLTLRGRDPTVSLKIQPDWGPNVFVSVLALRGRLHEVPWYSLFTWGWRDPAQWWSRFWYEGRAYTAPGSLIDLSKPAHRLGVAELRVDSGAHRLAVQVKADRETYPVRGQAWVTVTVRQPDGRPAAHAEVAIAAVDQALLELMPNTSWDVLSALLQRRSWGVETATAQMEVLGRRHYGRKALPAGGGGGKSPTRELLDTLLLWQPRVTLDAQGQARVRVPLNDSLSRFTIVAVADAGVALFGSASTQIRSTQDLQLISGLPPLVRSGDRWQAQVTVRNTSTRAMQIEVSAQVGAHKWPAQTLALAAGAAAPVQWPVETPALTGGEDIQTLRWTLHAQDRLSPAQDTLRITQQVHAAVPLQVGTSVLTQLDGTLSLPLAPPPHALPGRGGVQISLQASLGDALPGLRRWWQHYPYACLEQQTSRALSLRDRDAWQRLTPQLASYRDRDGLANYFPTRPDQADQGSDSLSAYLLAASDEAARLDPALALPEAERAPLLAGLTAFVEGRIQRPFWSTQPDLVLRKIAALEALSRYGRMRASQLQSLRPEPAQWPSASVIDWINLLRRVPDLPQRDSLIAQAQKVLRARLIASGSQLRLQDDPQPTPGWLMQHPDANAARLLLLALDDPAWAPERPALAGALLQRQAQGAWQTTVANFWASLALARLSRQQEAEPVQGQTRIQWGDTDQMLDWRGAQTAARAASGAGTAASAVLPKAAGLAAPRAATAAQAGTHGLGSAGPLPGSLGTHLPWPTGAGTRPLSLTHQGHGKPWLTLQTLSAWVPTQPLNAGYRLTRSVQRLGPDGQPLADAAPYRVGDVLQVTLRIDASATQRWVAIDDPLPAGAAVLGTGLGRDTLVPPVRGPSDADRGADPDFVEAGLDAWRAYFALLPQGTSTLRYTLRLNNAGDFALPPTRAQAMYAPDVQGLLPNARLTVQAAP
ncbi:MAG: MG2 domain-containing protein [Rhodoferax sp.]